MTILLQKDNEFIEEYSQKCYNIYCENYGEKLKISHLPIKMWYFFTKSFGNIKSLCTFAAELRKGRWWN